MPNWTCSGLCPFLSRQSSEKYRVPISWREYSSPHLNIVEMPVTGEAAADKLYPHWSTTYLYTHRPEHDPIWKSRQEEKKRNRWHYDMISFFFNISFDTVRSRICSYISTHLQGWVGHHHNNNNNKNILTSTTERGVEDENDVFYK